MRETGVVRFRYYGDRHQAELLTGIGRKLLGEMKERMMLGGINSHIHRHTTESGVVYEMISNSIGFADIDEVRIYVPVGKPYLDDISIDRCIGFIIAADSSALEGNIYVAVSTPEDIKGGNESKTAIGVHLQSSNSIMYDLPENTFPSDIKDVREFEEDDYEKAILLKGLFTASVTAEYTYGSPQVASINPELASTSGVQHNSWTGGTVSRDATVSYTSPSSGETVNQPIPFSAHFVADYTGGFITIGPDKYKNEPIPGIPITCGGYPEAVLGTSSWQEGYEKQGAYNVKKGADALAGPLNQANKLLADEYYQAMLDDWAGDIFDEYDAACCYMIRNKHNHVAVQAKLDVDKGLSNITLGKYQGCIFVTPLFEIIPDETFLDDFEEKFPDYIGGPYLYPVSGASYNIPAVSISTINCVYSEDRNYSGWQTYIGPHPIPFITTAGDPHTQEEVVDNELEYEGFEVRADVTRGDYSLKLYNTDDMEDDDEVDVTIHLIGARNGIFSTKMKRNDEVLIAVGEFPVKANEQYLFARKIIVEEED